MVSVSGNHVDMTDIPGAQPPPGVEPNFVNPYSQGYIVDVVGSILISLMVISCTTRIYAKAKIQRNRSWDDC